MRLAASLALLAIIAPVLCEHVLASYIYHTPCESIPELVGTPALTFAGRMDCRLSAKFYRDRYMTPRSPYYIKALGDSPPMLSLGAPDEEVMPEQRARETWLENLTWNQVVQEKLSYTMRCIIPQANLTWNRSTADKALDFVNYAERNNPELIDSYYLDDHMRHFLESLAGMYETERAYRSEYPVQAVEGAVLAGHIINSLDEIVNATMTRRGLAPLISVFFGERGPLISLFGLLGKYTSWIDYELVPRPGASMAIELVNLGAPSLLSSENLAVRLYYAPGKINVESFRPLSTSMSTSSRLRASSAGNRPRRTESPWRYDAVHYNAFKGKVKRFAYQNRETMEAICKRSGFGTGPATRRERIRELLRSLFRHPSVLAMGGIAGIVVSSAGLAAAMAFGGYSMTKGVVEEEWAEAGDEPTQETTVWPRLES
ncbi:Histidine phosphatase superfamily [Emericellopsis cladophorae]|uniref:Histidine phosphatase superfamily n=1 Tax=Emericellopsis cladophorae TaxID=2686198 RepID=A0A9Q0BFQ6_9HYPO|nr:Histidine phosphatase superfamily [Emericellopsis cladophorae]KAI6783712.1 Histidine phosphatase superfamily [Emericellopsis cladophorae]